MAPRERVPPTPAVAAHDAASLAQRSLVFETNQRGRDETALLHALKRAFVLLRTGAQESALRESFVMAMTGLGAEKGVLIQVREQHPPDVEILHASGLNAENEAAFRDLRSSPGVSPTVIRTVIDSGEPRLIENSNVLGLDLTPSLRGRSHSVLCVPVVDSLVASVVAVLYLQNE